MRTIFRALPLASLAFAWAAPCRADVLDVPDRFPKIQAAIEAAQSGDTILVRPGTYLENLDFGGKKIVITSLDPADPSVVAATVIDGRGKGSVVTFRSKETSATELRGLTLRGGSSDEGGGVFIQDASPTLRRNRIEGNRAGAGGGILCRGPGKAVIIGNAIRSNHADGRGGGILCDGCSPEITGNVFDRNHAAQGGGIACVEASPAIRNVTLAGNVAKEGGGVDCLNSSPTITNAVVAFSRGGGVRADKGSEPALRYACFFKNQGGNLVDLIASGPGILEGDPLFADPEAGDYHLRSLGGRLARVPLGGKMTGPGQVPTTVAHWIVDAVHSPCIDAGDSSAVFEVEPEPHGGRVNLGAFGGTEEASKAIPAPFYQPDLSVQALEGGGLEGDGHYGDGSEAPVTFWAEAGSIAYQRVRIENDGNRVDRYVLQAKIEASGGEVVIYDETTGGGDITKAISGKGWGTPALEPGQALELEVKVSGSVGKPIQVELRSDSSQDQQKHDVLKIRTEYVASGDSAQPDLWIKMGDGEYEGNGTLACFVQGIFSGNPHHPITRVNGFVGQAEPAVFTFTLENGGDRLQRLRVHGACGGTGWTTKAYDAASGGNEMTSALTTGGYAGEGWLTPVMPPGGKQEFRVVMTPGSGVTPGGEANAHIRAEPEDPPPVASSWFYAPEVMYDEVHGKAWMVPAGVPTVRLDLRGRVHGSYDFVGDDVYSPDYQEIPHVAPTWSSLRAFYMITLQNEGVFEETVLIDVHTPNLSQYIPQNQQQYVVGLWHDVPSPQGGIGSNSLPDTREITLSPGEIESFTVGVDPPDNMPPGESILIPIHVRKASEPAGNCPSAEQLHLRAIVIKANPGDLLVRAPSTGSWLGGGVYEDPAAQTASHAFSAGESADFQVRLVNRESVPMSFLLRSNSWVPDWNLSWYDAASGGSAITAEVTGNIGWPTPCIPPSGDFLLRLSATRTNGVTRTVELCAAPYGGGLITDQIAVSLEPQ